jgi:tetratricopeptide (TPR) repeat protein
MNRYPRKPALIVLAIVVLLGGAYLIAWNRAEAKNREKAGGNSVEAIEKKIAEEKAGGVVSLATWRAYGDALMDAKEFAKAAVAFQELLQLDPRLRDVKFQRGLALAQSGAGDAFYQFQKDLVYSEPKLALEIFERAETQRYQAEERFSSLAREAKHQAMD